MSRWFRTHWFRVAMALFILAATLIEWAAIPPVYPLNFLFSGISVVGIVLSPFMPRTSGWMIIATVLGRLFVLDLSGPNPLWLRIWRSRSSDMTAPFPWQLAR
ncbi:hypothetical protein BW14_03065 [Bifidobacterium sp. UTBIF-68]|uniref:hypothetical protein n=1 Tax=Bifidobacterium sp. UTBIF-68 TaxID=1465262 RepID=UPI0015E342AD|nr:hypothetical protein [Bifidobacterium sp. UTBIF-68]TPF94027.1 hypothetical protein BW14_03065 [Bifidobacterium sp. UTBIF-68]